MNRQRSTDRVLGVMATGSAVHAVLMEHGEDGPEVLRRFTRRRAPAGAPAETPGVGATLPDLGEDNDFTLQFGDGADDMGGELFLNSEFDLDDLKGDDAAVHPTPFVMELADILDECRDAGYEQPRVVFGVGARHVEHVELLLPDIEAPDDGARPSVSRRKLLARLKQQHNVDDDEQVAFLPMTLDGDGVVRYLALLPAASEPVTPTVRTLRAEHRRLNPRLQYLDAEVSLSLGLARSAFEDEIGAAQAAGEPANTLFVRAGADDTLVLFLRGDRLHHTEVLRSLTAFDAPETICSRVLLLQDEYGIGEVEQVLVAHAEDDEDLVDSFEMFFPSARIASLHRFVPDQLREDERMEAAEVAAAAAGLRILDPDRFATFFEDVNLLPSQLLRRRIDLPVSWSNIALLALLFVTSLFFVWRFFSYEHEIQTKQTQLHSVVSSPMHDDPQQLQQRIDSLQQTATNVAHALGVMDSLLVGSDRWSRTLATTAGQIASVRGIWIDGWTPADRRVTLTGSATAREHVVRLAQALDGDIQELTFSEIREWPVYSFQMTLPLAEDLPAATRYLRERTATRGEPPVPARSASLDS